MIPVSQHGSEVLRPGVHQPKPARWRWGFILGALLILPNGAHAGPASPVLLAGYFHLTLGPYLVAYLETLILKSIYRINFKQALGTMVTANYTSTWIGFFIIITGIMPAFGRPILGQFFVILGTVTSVSVLLALLVELPFLRYVFRREGFSWRQTVSGLLTIHFVSFSLVTSLYFYISDTSFFTITTPVEMDELALPYDVLLVYENREEKQVIFKDFNSRESWVFPVESGVSMSYVRKEAGSDRDSDSYFLVISHPRLDAIEIPIDHKRIRFGRPHGYVSTFGYSSGEVAIATGVDSDFKASGFYPLRVQSQIDSELQYSLFGDSLITPGMLMFNPIIVAPDIVLFHVSYDGIVALNMRSRKIAHVKEAFSFAVIPREDFVIWFAERDKEKAL